MTRLAAFLLVLTTGAATASADGYVSLGIGKSDLGGQLSDNFNDTDSDAYRLTVGQRFGNFALEANLLGSQFAGASSVPGTDDRSTLSLGVDLKYHFFHAGPLSLYGKGGLNKTWLRGENGDHSGTGYELGAGAELGFNLPFASLAVFAELAHLQTALRGEDERALDGSINTAMIGVSVGF